MKNRILVQARKEWVEFRRDRFSLALAFLLPFLSLLLFGFGIRLEAKNIPMAIADLDSTPLSREYVDRLYATNVFTRVELRKGESAKQALDSGRAKVAIVIPSGFSENLYSGKKMTLPVSIDGTDIINAQVVDHTIENANAHILKSFKDSVENPNATLRVVPQVRVWFNPGNKESMFIVPAVFGVVLWMYPCLLAAVAAAREKENGTIIRVFASKLSAIEWLLGKAIVYVGVFLCLALVIFPIGWLLFGVLPIADPTVLIVATPIYIICSVFFGLMIGTLASSQTTAVQATSTGSFFPCFLLSGFVYPINNIPFPLSLISYMVPARYYIEISRDAYLRGVGWPAVWQDPLILVMLSATGLFISWLGLRKMQLKD